VHNLEILRTIFVNSEHFFKPIFFTLKLSVASQAAW